MTTTGDSALVVEQETTYKTYATPTRALEFVDEGLDWGKNPKQGKGLKATRRMARSGRRVIPSADGNGDIMFELASKGLGKILDSAFGASTVTLVGGSTYQHVYTLGDNPKSLTVQKQLVEAGLSAVDAYSFLGVMIASLEFSFPNQDIGQLKVSTDIGDVTTAQTAASLVYPTLPSLFHFQNWSIATGTLTAPTTIALASMTSTWATFRDASVSLNHNLRGDRFNGGGGGRKTKPTVGLRADHGSATVEYADTTFRDAVLNDTSMALMFQYTGAALSTGVETVQLILPEVRFDSELPKTNGTDLITAVDEVRVLDNEVAAQPIWLVIRTSDATL
jgi:hypothetical protein